MHPCAFLSWRLSAAESNYDVGNRELLAVKVALEEWRHWLEGAQHPFIVWTDHKNLEYIKQAKRLNSRQARWALFFNRFRFTLSYRPGSRNVKPDALSRIYDPEPVAKEPEPILPLNCVVGVVTWQIEQEVKQANGETPPPSGCPEHRLFVPVDLRPQVIHWAHTSLLTCHPGVRRTMFAISQRFWWPSMESGVWEYIEVLTAVDRFSKMTHFIALPKLPSAKDTAQIMMQNIFRIHGFPKDIVSDRGPQFISRFWKEFCRLIGATASLTSGYHPEANGQTERLNQQLETGLRCLVSQNPTSWSTHLVWVEYAHNSLPTSYLPQVSPHSSVPMVTSLLCLLTLSQKYQFPPPTPWFAAGTASGPPPVKCSSVGDRVKRAADRRRRPAPEYRPGQRVWLSAKDLHLKVPSKKLAPRFVGPFPITKVISPAAIRLRLPRSLRVHPTFHVSQVKPTKDSPMVPATKPPQPLEAADGGSLYKVKSLFAVRNRGRGKQFLVDWEGYGPEERQWIPRSYIDDPSLIQDFYKDHPQLPGPSGVGPSRGGSVTPR